MSLCKQTTNCSNSFFNQILLPLNVQTGFLKPSNNGLLALWLHSAVFQLFQHFRNQGQGKRSGWMVNTTYDREEPFLRPNPFACVVLRTKRFVIKVWWEGRVVCKTLSFYLNGLLCQCNDHVEFIVQHLTGITI